MNDIVYFEYFLFLVIIYKKIKKTLLTFDQYYIIYRYK
jgi:hypothetical protein